MTRALILDFDGSVKPLEGAVAMPLRHREEEVRFACSRKTLRSLTEIATAMAPPPFTVFLGSGDFHHVTLALIDGLSWRSAPIEVVVFDNHPDNMRYPLGVHCGSWVWHVSQLPFVARVHVAGITSSDVEPGHVWENHLGPLRSGKVVYWCIGRTMRGLIRAGVRQSRTFSTVGEMLGVLAAEVVEANRPVYLSIDKDVLHRDVVQTNWDQGVMRLEELESAVRMLRDRLIGSDVVGDVSSYRYRSRFKRILSGIDRQPEVPASLLEPWQARHQVVNQRLLSLLSSEALEK